MINREEWKNEEWKKIDLAKCRQLVHSMPRRLGAVIKNHGGHTKY